MRWISLVLITLIVLGSIPVYAQGDVLTPSELAQAGEARHLLRTYAGDVWIGWGDTIPAMLLRKGDYDYWIGNPAPPEPFQVGPDMLIDGVQVYRSEGHQVPVPAATSWQVGDQWVIAVPVLDEFQAAIDEMLGEGVIVLDDAAYIRSIVHEAFHAYHFATFDGFDRMPGFVQLADDSWLGDLTEAEQMALDEALLAEGQALAAALEPDATVEDIRSAAAEFLRLRETRRAALPDAAPDFERGTEWVEGAARYADMSLMLLAGQPDYSPSTQTGYLPEDKIWEQFRDALADLSLVPGSYRDRLYELGAAQMFVLDRLFPGWQLRLWDEGVTVEDLLAEALEAK